MRDVDSHLLQKPNTWKFSYDVMTFLTGVTLGFKMDRIRGRFVAECAHIGIAVLPATGGT
jgi:hypothetical protein